MWLSNVIAILNAKVLCLLEWLVCGDDGGDAGEDEAAGHAHEDAHDAQAKVDYG